MCLFILQVPFCGHNPALLAGSFCCRLRDELQRINDPASWTEEGRKEIPFKLDAEHCEPNPRNIRIVYTDDYCCWECRNDHAAVLLEEDDQGGWLETRVGVMGMPDAEYGPGSERIGVGWREA